MIIQKYKTQAASVHIIPPQAGLASKGGGPTHVPSGGQTVFAPVRSVKLRVLPAAFP